VALRLKVGASAAAAAAAAVAAVLEEEAAGDSGVRQGRASHIETRVVATRQTAASLTIAEPAFSLARSRDSLTHLLLFNNSQYSVNFLSPLDLTSLLFFLF
jgi:hypothetical protein